MANEDSVLREVDQELAEDRQWAMFRRYGPAAIGASAALIVGVGAWQVYEASRTNAANQQALAFAEANERLVEDETDGRDALEAIAEKGGSGYAALAQFRRAASLSAAHDRKGAIDAFVEIYQDGGIPQSLRGLARIRAGYLSLQDSREEALGHLGALAERDSAYKPYADEIIGLGALKAEDYETALSIFTALANNPSAPAPLVIRAEEFAALALSGKAGVNLTGRFQLDDIIGAVGEATSEDAAASVEEIVDPILGADDASDAIENEQNETAESENE